MFNVVVETIKKTECYYMRRVGAYGVGNYALMDKLKKFAKSHDMLTDDALIYGVALDNPEYVSKENCRYDVCLVTGSCENLKKLEGVQVGMVTGGKYLTVTIPHTAEAVDAAWGQIGDLVAYNGCVMDSTRQVMERYSVLMVKNSLCQMCIPIK